LTEFSRTRKSTTPKESILSLEIPHEGLSAFVSNLAKQHGVAHEQASARLASNDLEPDTTKQLVTALRRANVITDQEVVTILVRHFDDLGI